MSPPYTIAGLARAAGVHIETIRYYQRLKLVPEPPRPLGSIRRYSEVDAERLRFIKRAQAMGFTLSEITSLLTLQRRRSCRATRELAAGKLRRSFWKPTHASLARPSWLPSSSGRKPFEPTSSTLCPRHEPGCGRGVDKAIVDALRADGFSVRYFAEAGSR
jgi:DNA-binding transcriptional MerR regulator